ncbi:MAG: hypothetical protein AseanaTS_10190 [Candidatus Pelagadaptatus aseana]
MTQQLATAHVHDNPHEHIECDFHMQSGGCDASVITTALPQSTLTLEVLTAFIGLNAPQKLIAAYQGRAPPVPF